MQPIREENTYGAKWSRIGWYKTISCTLVLLINKALENLYNMNVYVTLEKTNLPLYYSLLMWEREKFCSLDAGQQNL
jgi:hypothetical protein